ncbi:predicted protein [Heterostelium album PN500]|uniref:Pyrroloquinoline quinone-dependent pyranose dehydrogenase beta-propeller domain-containing protein n=1 Tax=Heterostelium pallidum (strain ATCC 26659 / Pp 5 / PN500) TaxID=670386 RepID=D3BRJ1_HETP5|nr:predicted protein [Heterostelium album PN500]EFA76023.1 predicted protein [Heterostelium album PN500]|eukprot:XP_020428157.1 predicted protein [Heterostelium album PN500]
MNHLKSFILLSIVVIIGYSSAQPQCAYQVANSKYFIQDGYCVWEYKTGLSKPRQLYVASNGDVLVSTNGIITVMYDLNQNGVIDSNESATLATAPGLNHAVTVTGKYLYATSPSTAYRWRYTPGNRTDLGTPEVVLNNMPSDGHVTRTLAMIDELKFYISIGSGSNVDPNSSRARVYYCDATGLTLPINFTNCVVQADGCRNEVGLRFDPTGRLWGVENGMDELSRPDLVADAHINNPCEEINLLESRGSFYGYPRCWSEGYLPPNVSKGVGANFGVLKSDDDWCFNQSNVVRPKFCMPAHTAPLDLLFWNSTTFQPPYDKGMFVTQHGSWNRVPSSGYQVVHIQTDSNYNPVNATMTKLFGGIPGVKGDQWAFRPVSVVRLAPCGINITECLLISSDDPTGTIIAIRYSGHTDSYSSGNILKPVISSQYLSITIVLLLSIITLLF